MIETWRHRLARTLDPLTANPLGAALLRYAAPLLALYGALWLLYRHNRPPVGVFLFGGVIGLLYALGAFGLILIYRANRIINFANAQIGASAGLLALLLVKSRFHLAYPLALLLALAAGTVTGAVVELLIIRRFAHAPRLILSVVTIFVALPLAGLQFYLPKWITGRFVDPFPPKTFLSSLHATIGGFRFNANTLVVVIATLLLVAALSGFFKGTRTGIAVRGAAENSDRARLLGVPVKRINTVVWAIAGLLSAVAVFLRGPVIGLPVGGLIGPQLLLFSLTAAVIAGMDDFPVALVAGLALGVIDQTVYFFSRDPNLGSALTLPILIVVMVLQRQPMSRAQDAGIATWSMSQEFRPVPAELRQTPEVQWGSFGIKAAVLAAAIAAPIFFGTFERAIAPIILIYAIVGVSLVILTGWTGRISLGQWGFAGIGAVATSALAAHLHADLFVTLTVAGLAGAAVAAVVGLPALRIRGLYLAIVTLAFAVAVQVYVLSPTYDSHLLPTPTQTIRRPFLFDRFDLGVDRNFYWFCLAVLILALLSARSLRNSRTGRALVAARDNERGAQSYGISVNRARLFAFAVSGFWAAVAGGLFAFHQGAIDTAAFDPSVSILLLEVVVIGGLTSLPGALTGAAVIEGVRYYIHGQSAQLLTSGLGILIFLMVFPGGLAEAMYAARDGLLRWVAARRRIHVPSLVADRRLVADEGMIADEESELAAFEMAAGSAPNGNGGLRRADRVVCPACGEVVPVDAVLEHEHFVGAAP